MTPESVGRRRNTEARNAPESFSSGCRLPDYAGGVSNRRTFAALALWALWVAFTLEAKPPEARREVQRHGVLFEEWIRDTFFGGYRPADYTQRWDIPASVNTNHGGIPVNPKAAKFGAPVDMGDALRQFDIQEPFLLIVGFWRQDGEVKRFVNVQAVRVEPDRWRELWGNVTRGDLERLDAVIKDPTRSVAEARQAAQALKRRSPFRESVIQVNPKIDARQRRLQCSLRFADFFRHLAPEASREAIQKPELFGVALPAELASPPRSFRPSAGKP